jgi:hypothetical protein
MEYGTAEDGEYLSIARNPRRAAARLVTASLLAWPALIIRFLVLAPFRWLYKPINNFVSSRASSLAIDGEHLLCSNIGEAQRISLLQEVACWSWCVVLFVLLLIHVNWVGRFLEAGVVVSAIAVLNSLRILAAHQYTGMGDRMSLARQVQDSNDFIGPLAELWAPVGLRFHAMHHLFPSLPYHALPEARKRLQSCPSASYLFPNTPPLKLYKVLKELFRRHRKAG